MTAVAPSLDHIGFNVTDFASMKSFLLAALEPLGIGIAHEGEGWAMLGRGTKGQLWFGSFGAPPGSLHIAFAADNREQVRAFHALALAAGGRDHGGPGLRPHYHADYYGAFVIGPDGHNIEAVCHVPEPAEAAAARELSTVHELNAEPQRIYAAFEDPAQMAQWLGPAGFSNRIGAFDFREGGRWDVTMIAPDGQSFDNRWAFIELKPARRLVMYHLGPLHAFELAVDLQATAPGRTRLTWRQRFDSIEECQRVAPYVAPANEQNLDRLAALLALGH
jgi:uncharacterized protein YndB with AHSA1/START domain/catechol 2,3-dioxygenase-like lactoylglutathione lyase family enzyme